ncbi:MAG: phosphoglycolate phosphatase [Burkholderiaceae bacterium]
MMSASITPWPSENPNNARETDLHALIDPAKPTRIQRPAAVLFDLDGTLADTAPDLCAPANRMRQAKGLAPLPVSDLGRFASAGARGILGRALNVTPEDEAFEPLRQEFLRGYEAGLVVETALFPGMAEALLAFENAGIPWGVVSNKTEVYVKPILEQLGLGARSACAIGGDTAARAKPHPDPLFLAAELLKVDPARCLYVGDDERDIVAGEAAGMLTIAAAYGYCGDDSPPQSWNADFLVDNVPALLELISLQA